MRTVAIIGAGYVGLPLANAFANAGLQVCVYDTNEERIHNLRQGISFSRHLHVHSKVKFFGHPECLSEAEAILICVPTPLNDETPDTSCIESAAIDIRNHTTGCLVVLESTVYPGATRHLLQAPLGDDYQVAYSPEREDPGSGRSLTGIPKLVGGVTEQARDMAVSLYQQAGFTMHPVSSCEVAESAKLVENTYRAVNIALANEFREVFDQLSINVWEVIEAAASKPFGFQAFYPGPGVGGHCIGVDEQYLVWEAENCGIFPRLIKTARAVNSSTPFYIVHCVKQAVDVLQGSHIGVLGVAYKPDVEDTRQSPAECIINELWAEGARVSYYDSLVPQFQGMHTAPCFETWLRSLDCCVIVTPHSDTDLSLVKKHCDVVVNTRGA